MGKLTQALLLLIFLSQFSNEWKVAPLKKLTEVFILLPFLSSSQMKEKILSEVFYQLLKIIKNLRKNQLDNELLPPFGFGYQPRGLGRSSR